MYNCWFCKDKGHFVIQQIREVDGKHYTYYFAAHCDKCSAGQIEKIDYTTENGTRYYTEAASKYINADERIKLNKENAKKEKKQFNKATYKAMYKVF